MIVGLGLGLWETSGKRYTMPKKKNKKERREREDRKRIKRKKKRWEYKKRKLARLFEEGNKQ